MEKKESCDILIVGAGITAITLAERLANDGKKVLIIDKREQIGGNCYDYRDQNGILIKKYGPHIFHTKSEEVFNYISKFTKLNNYKHKVISSYKGKYYPIPINRTTINRFYKLDLKTEKEVIKFLDSKKVSVKKINNSRDVVISKFGEELYEAFVKHYTKKQWDLFPEELDKEVLERLPIRYDENDQYFDDKHQGMPEEGYTYMLKNMLKNENITIKLKTDFFKVKDKIKFKTLIFTGKLDEFFDYKFGKLDYRCITFKFETKNMPEFQPNSVVNYTDKDPEFTRITEFNKFYDQVTENTVICKEFTSWDGEPSYPVPNKKNDELKEKYLNEAKKLKNTFFGGRLGTYRYLNIDKAILEALNLYKEITKSAI